MSFNQITISTELQECLHEIEIKNLKKNILLGEKIG